PIVITGVMGYNGSYTPITAYTTTVELKENKAPSFVSISFDKDSLNAIKMTFNEEIKETSSITANISQLDGSYSRSIGSTVIVEGNNVIFNLDTIPDNNSGLKVDIIDHDIRDANGNKATLQSTYIVMVRY
ncbi:MAG: hypothetical protein GX359_02470, partial [Clostridiales bacterium]|nr:hypothetical protein [Clostridiales bacterium]